MAAFPEDRPDGAGRRPYPQAAAPASRVMTFVPKRLTARLGTRSPT